MELLIGGIAWAIFVLALLFWIGKHIRFIDPPCRCGADRSCIVQELIDLVTEGNVSDDHSVSKYDGGDTPRKDRQ